MDLKLSKVIHNQAIFNCGTAGHVAHGKSTLVKKLTGTSTQRYQKEKERNITIKLGYANSKMFLDSSGKVISKPSKITAVPDAKLLNHVSFVDCPGHRLYMGAMVSGSKIMDHATVVIAANEKIPQEQTHQHIMALGYSRITDVSFILNKMDLIKEKDVPKVKRTLIEYLATMGYTDPVIYPMSAATGENVNEYCQYLAGRVLQRVPHIIKQSSKPLRMNVVRSYNVNRPNTAIENMVGAVIGGSIQSGVLTVGDQVELRPGVFKMHNGKKVLQPLVARVLSLESDKNKMEQAIPGGLVGVNLSIYAGLSNNDRLKGQLLGHVGHLPDMYTTIMGKYRMIDIGAGESMVLNTNSVINVIVNGVMNVGANIVRIIPSKKDTSKGKIELKLKSPVVMDLKEENSVAIMLNPQNGGTLVASISVAAGDLDVEVVYPEGTDMDFKPKEYNIINDLEPYEHQPADFDILKDSITYRKKGDTSRIIIPTLSITVVHKNSFIDTGSINDLISALSHDTEHIVKKPVDLKKLLVENIAREFSGSDPRYNGDGTLVLNGKYRPNQMASFLTIFTQKLLCCPSCRSIKTTLGYDEKTKVQTIYRQCHNCPSVTYLHTTDMGKI